MGIIRFENFTIVNRADNKPILNDISLSINERDVHCLIGRSGEGKSTLIKALNGLLDPNTWRVHSDLFEVNGKPVSMDEFLSKGRQKTGFKVAFPEPCSFMNPGAAIGRQFQDILRLSGLRLSPSERAARIHELMMSVGLSGDDASSHFNLLKRFPHELSGGQRQRISIALALVSYPVTCFFADEPTHSMDPDVVSDFVRLILRFHREGKIKSIVLATHDIDVMNYLDLSSVAVWRVEKGSLTRVNSFKQEFIEPLALWTAALKESAKTCPSHEEACLKIGGLAYRYPGKWMTETKRIPVFSHLDLQLNRGEFIAIHGKNGSGKTTLMKLLSGILKSKEGTISYGAGRGGKSTLKASDSVSMIFQDPDVTFDPAMTIYDHIKQCYGRRVFNDDVFQRRLFDLLDHFELHKGLLFKLPSHISSGQKQRFATIRGLLKEPLILLADEPFSMVDFHTMQLMVDHLLGLKAKGLAMILNSHDHKLSRALCDRVYDLGPVGLILA